MGGSMPCHLSGGRLGIGMGRGGGRRLGTETEIMACAGHMGRATDPRKLVGPATNAPRRAPLDDQDPLHK